jgi:hypothetical protein
MKKIILNVTVAVMAVVLASCSGVKREKLIGAWSPVSMEAVINGETQELPTDDVKLTITYNEDSTVVMAAPLFGSKVIPFAKGNWTLEGKKLTVTYTESLMGAMDDKTQVNEILELSDSTLVCQATDSIDGVTATTKTKYVRVTE